MIYLMGVQYLGLNSLFSSILQVLNLAELGVGSAMVYSMYKPIAEDDAASICALEKLYRTYYNIIGLVIAIVGCLLIPFIPNLINGEIPSELNVQVLYILNLGATVLTYWLFAYKNSLFFAHQRNDVTSKITVVTNSVQYALQLLALWLFHSYYLYVIIMLATQVLNNVLIAICANRFYPNYKPYGNLPKSTIKVINRRIKDVFTAKLGSTIVNSADTIVISAFLGLTILAMYQNYYFIMSSIIGIIAIFLDSFLAGIGNSIVTESIDKNYGDFKKIVFIINWMVTICISCFACVYQPFIRVWVGDSYTFDYQVVILLCVYFYLIVIQRVIGTYKDAAGIWHQDRFRPLIAAAVNLTLNIAFVKIWGIYAIIFSTIVSYLVVSMPWMIWNVFKYVFKRSFKEYLMILAFDILVCTATACVCFFLSNIIPMVNDSMSIVCRIVICVIVSNALLWLFNRKNPYYSDMIDYLDRFTKNKFSKILTQLKN